MKHDRIILVVSDFHMSSGPITREHRVNPFENFFQDDQFADFLDFYSKGSYRSRPVELVINGDFFEFIDTYLDDVDPYCPYEEDECRKLEMIFRGHPRVFTALRHFLKKKNRTVTFIVGNHDQSLLFPRVQKMVRDRIGHPVSFKCFEYRVGEVLIQHGNQLEGVFGAIREPYFLADRTGRRYLNYTEGSRFHIQSIIGAKKIFPLLQQIRHYRLFFRWLWLFRRTLFLKLFFYTLFSLGRMFLTVRHFRETLRRFGRLLKWFQVKDIDELLRRQPAVFDSARVHICGHSHYYKCINMSDHHLYINTGSWTPAMHLNIGSLGRLTRLTYCYFELRGGQAENISLKEWCGYHRPDKNVFTL